MAFKRVEEDGGGKEEVRGDRRERREGTERIQRKFSAPELGYLADLMLPEDQDI